MSERLHRQAEPELMDEADEALAYPIFRSKVCSIRVFRGIACRKLLCVGAWFSF